MTEPHPDEFRMTWGTKRKNYQQLDSTVETCVGPEHQTP